MTTHKEKVDAQIAKLMAKVNTLKKSKKGCVRYHEEYNRWTFTWREDGKQRGKSFSVAKYGMQRAKKLAEEYRATVFGK